jgi:spermidine synthase
VLSGVGALLMFGSGVEAWRATAQVVFETTSAYHHIQVIDRQGVRILSFDGSQETRMSLRNPLEGHFLYTEFFHLPWLWCDPPRNVLMVGLGGGSVQRAYQHHYPAVKVETVEIDPVVLGVAKRYFQFQETPMMRVIVEDGRVYLRRTEHQYDAILMDAYRENRYGSFLPYHLVTKEFFALAHQRLTDRGVIVYNVIGSLYGSGADLVGAVYNTMKSVFPRVYLFPSPDSQNVVLIGTKSRQAWTLVQFHERAAALVGQGRVKLPTFRQRAVAARTEPPLSVMRSPVLTDDFAPVDGLLRSLKPATAPPPARAPAPVTK